MGRRGTQTLSASMRSMTAANICVSAALAVVRFTSDCEVRQMLYAARTAASSAWPWTVKVGAVVAVSRPFRL